MELQNDVEKIARRRAGPTILPRAERLSHQKQNYRDLRVLRGFLRSLPRPSGKILKSLQLLKVARDCLIMKVATVENNRDLQARH